MSKELKDNPSDYEKLSTDNEKQELEKQGINIEQEPSDKPGITYNIDGYGYRYEIKWELREKFPDSYFYWDYHDDSICGVNLLTGSIIYELQGLGYGHTDHVEGHSGGLNDRLECGGIVSNRMFKLTHEQLEGKVPPTVILIDKDLEYWDHVRGYLFGEHIGGLLADGLI